MYDKLIRLKNECLDELKTIDLYDKIPIGIEWQVDKRSKSRLGVCKRRRVMNYTYTTIAISEWVLRQFKDSDIKNTIMHELLHSIKECKGHGYEWQRYASIVNRKLHYNISRLANIQALCESNNIDMSRFVDNTYKYEIKCKKCGAVWHKNRLTNERKWQYKNNYMKHKVCGGDEFIITDLKNDKVVIG